MQPFAAFRSFSPFLPGRVHGAVLAGGAADFFFEDTGEAHRVGIAHLAADEIELVVGLPDQAAGLFHAQAFAVAAEGRAADLAEDRADIVGGEAPDAPPDRPA